MLKSKPRRSKKLLWLSRLLVLTAIATIVTGGIVSWNQYYTNKQTDQNPQEHTDSDANPTTTSPPATRKPDTSEFDNYKVAADLPRYIFIPKIAVKAMIKQVGITKDNQIDTPANVHDTAWYNQSAKPGQPGAMLIDGHVSSWKTHGVFYDLKKLVAGDSISIERGDGTILAYRVTKKETYDADKVDMAATLAPINPAKPGLNLITCAGNVVKGTNDFDKRIVVFAEQL